MRWFKPEAGSIEIFSPQGIVPSRTTPLTEQRSFHKLDRSAPSSSSSHRRRRGCIRRPHAPQRLAVFPEQRSLIASRHYFCHSPPSSFLPQTLVQPRFHFHLHASRWFRHPPLPFTLPYPTLLCTHGAAISLIASTPLHSSLLTTRKPPSPLPPPPFIRSPYYHLASKYPVTPLPKTATATKTPR